MRPTTPDPLRRTAVHEAAHAVVGTLIPGVEVVRVSIDRADASGLTEWMPPAGSDRRAARAELAIGVAGGAAEALIR